MSITREVLAATIANVSKPLVYRATNPDDEDYPWYVSLNSKDEPIAMCSEHIYAVTFASAIGAAFPEFDLEAGYADATIAPLAAPYDALPVRPHSRACGIRKHAHGSECHANCPTCGGRVISTSSGASDG